MWLIHTNTLELRYTVNAEDYKYAILSHTWGNDEVTFDDMKHRSVARKKSGYQKIRKTCERASQQGLDWAWVDTCCIDKSSSAELSESINSMFEWYRLSAVCYAWLEYWDGSTPAIRNSRWFTRGWTLQELIAPSSVEFLDHEWAFRGNKLSLGSVISSVTRIDLDVLLGLKELADIPVARRMSWAAARQTTRVEDRAYSLLGIFGINMPLLYGEGQKAFLQLQEEIAKNSSDLSLFAWEIPQDLQDQAFLGIFAATPDYFRECGTLTAQRNQFYNLNDFVITNRGLSIRTSLVRCEVHGQSSAGLSLWCHTEEQPDTTLAVPLLMTASGYSRSHHGKLGSLRSPFPSPSSFSIDAHHDAFYLKDSKHILICKEISTLTSHRIGMDSSHFLSVEVSERYHEVTITGFPPALWNADQSGFHLAGCTEFVGIVVISVRFEPDISSSCELQIVCGYCKEVGGCWASLVSKTKPKHELDPQEIRCAALLSKFRSFKDEACANSWYGYQFLRHYVFYSSSTRSGGPPTKTNMRVDGFFELPVPQRDHNGTQNDFDFCAHLECAENANIGGPNGKITVATRWHG